MEWRRSWHLRGDLLLVPQNVRAHDERANGQAALLHHAAVRIPSSCRCIIWDGGQTRRYRNSRSGLSAETAALQTFMTYAAIITIAAQLFRDQSVLEHVQGTESQRQSVGKRPRWSGRPRLRHRMTILAA